MAIRREFFLQSKLKMVGMRAEKSHLKDLVIIIQAKRAHRMHTHRRKILSLMKIQNQTSCPKLLVRAKKLKVLTNQSTPNPDKHPQMLANELSI